MVRRSAPPWGQTRQLTSKEPGPCFKKKRKGKKQPTMVDDMPYIRAQPKAGVRLPEVSSSAVVEDVTDEEPDVGGPTASPDLEFVWEEYQKRLQEEKEWNDNGVDIHPDYGKAYCMTRGAFFRGARRCVCLCLCLCLYLCL
jgi:hypothetical protein